MRLWPRHRKLLLRGTFVVDVMAIAWRESVTHTHPYEVITVFVTFPQEEKARALILERQYKTVALPALLRSHALNNLCWCV
jgi:hypothetical protein